ncbi:hypothetical protein TMatcc_004063 [Talaromyces marneffei ATCC 18224]|uniref:C2H2-type domain-containing protein n=2 Tax=Talaromyces marneffei TaxID=37727 RepID=B6Q6L3_TALMQ|nr:uncharacterized protein EYB26_000958 [Talaromyces marneffei]EEA27639.1 conserved hypothetical protein [Talaromyces marneffei ATCC 18224]KAE8556675.1 hypothetical protein EYB25_001378 [Talaromyces marneffei]QGA13310.1 hypothetical protein EYB26_000958 [Talaromyces marneffei]
MNAPFGAGDFLLHYNTQYKLLICVECKYAIQNHAVDSHLLRHKIYRGERQQLLSAISELELPEPDDVQFPSEPCEPVDGLPVIAGYKCTATGCGSLYASVKRMRRHWSEYHGVTDMPESYTCAVNMQTFFRGTKIRYFEVLKTSLLVSNGRNSQQQQSLDSVTIPRLYAQPVESSSTPGLDLDLEKLRYFHHFITTTSLTLPTGNPNATKFWQTDVISHALNLRWMMFGLLSITASHLAVISEDRDVKRIHLERSVQFCQAFLAGWNEMKNVCLGEPDASNVIAIGARMACIQRLCTWMSDSSTLELISIQSFVTTLRGCANQDFILVSTIGDDTLRDIARQSITHLASPNASIRTDIAKCVLLEHFSNLPYHMAGKLGRPNGSIDFMAVMSAIGALIDCCHQVYEANDVETAWVGMEEWLKKVSGRFTELLVTEKSPAALILFAQWLLLVATAERFCWFSRGLAMKMLRLVVGELEEDGTFQGFLAELMGWALVAV